MALTPLKQRPATAYRRIPVPNGSVLLVPNDQIEPPPPQPQIPTPTAQWDVNTRGRQDDDLYEHQNGVLEVSTGGPAVDRAGNYDALVYNGTSQYTRCQFPASFTAGMPNADFTMAMRLAVNAPSQDFEWWFGWGKDADDNVRVGMSTGADTDTKASFVGDNGTPQWFGNPSPDAPQDGSQSVIVFRRESGNMSIWKDGLKVHEDIAPALDIATADVFEIAAQATGTVPRWFYDGRVYWVAVWDSALTDEEVGLLDNSSNPWGTPSPDPDPPEPPPISANYVKWNPGYYMLLRWQDAMTGKEAIRRSQVQQEAGVPEVTGFVSHYRWYALEGAQRGDYSVGFTNIDHDMSIAEDNGKQFILSFAQDSFNNNDAPAFFPGYIISGNHWQDTGNKFSWKFWDPVVRGYWKDMITALGNRYDSNPRFEGFQVNQETAHGSNMANIVTKQEYIDAYKDMMSHAKAAFPTSNITFVTNSNHWDSISNRDVFYELWEHALSIGVGCGSRDGGPQTVNGSRDGPIEIPHSSLGDNNYYYDLTRGNHEFLNRTCYIVGIEASQLGAGAVAEYGGYRDFVLQEWIRDYLKPSHQLLYRRTWDYSGHGSVQWQWNAYGVDGGHHMKNDLVIGQPLVEQGKLYPYLYPVTVTVGQDGTQYGYNAQAGTVVPTVYQTSNIVQLVGDTTGNVATVELARGQLPGIDNLYVHYGASQVAVLSWNGSVYQGTDAGLVTELSSNNGSDVVVQLAIREAFTGWT